MKKIYLRVPNDVEFISEWKEYNYPLGHCIVDKTVCGCGFTEYCLTNSLPTILCSPRKILLENKEEQHKGDIYYFRNEREEGILGLDNDGLSKMDVAKLSHVDTEIDVKIRQDYLSTLKCNLRNFILSQDSLGIPPKILVTYDSLKHVLDVINGFNINFYVVVDEFQSIFMDSKFKADVELDFVEYLQNCSNVMYLSATPMLDRYLDQMEEFRNLPYYELVWPELRIEKINLKRKEVRSIVTEVGNIIKQYKKGIFPKKIFEDGIVHESREVVFYVNSVKTITEIVKRNKLLVSEVNIICSKTETNKLKLKKIKHDFGRIPGKGEPHKMFTFCTRTTYLGADFYSTNAYTVICSDCNVETLALDISLDLPQIIGRQRLRENVFKNEVLFLYKIDKNGKSWRTETRDELDAMINRKRVSTEIILRNYSIMDELGKVENSRKYKDSIYYSKYLDDFVGVSGKTGYASYNRLVELAEIRAWEITRDQYMDNYVVKKTIENLDNINLLDISKGSTFIDGTDVNQEYQKFLYDFNNEGRFDKKMKLYCDFLRMFYDTIKTTNVDGVPQEYQNYVNLLGISRISSLGYYQAALEKEYKVIMSGDSRKKVILKTFLVGQRYTLKEIKEKLREIYTTLHLSKTPKASDLEEFFEVKKTKITTDNDGIKDGYLIVKLNKK